MQNKPAGSTLVRGQQRQFEAAFVSLAIDRKDIKRVGRAAAAAFKAL